MRKLFRDIHRGKRGFTGLEIVFLIAIIAAIGAGAYVGVNALMEEPSGVVETGETEVRNYMGWGCWYTNDYDGAISQSQNHGNVFVAQETVTLTQVQLKGGACGGGSYAYHVVVYTWDEVEEEPDELVGSSIPWNIGAMSQWCFGGGVLPTHLVNFYDDEERKVTLVEDETYVYRVEICSGSSGNTWWAARVGDSGCSEDVTPGCTAGSQYYDGELFQYWLVGYEVQEPEVTTIGAEIKPDGSVWLSGFTTVIADMNVGFLMSETESVVTGGAGINFPAGNTGLDDARHYFDTRVVSILSDVTYYYRAYAELDGAYWYGAVKSFQRLPGDILPELVCELKINTPDVVEFEVDFYGLPAETVWNITMYYGREITTCYGHNYSIVVALDVDEDGVWLVDETPSTFEFGAKYWYYACAVEELGTTVCSTLSSFVVFDPDVPWWMTWIATTLNIDVSWLWWVFLLLLFGGAWLWAAKARQPMVGIIASMLICIGLIVFDVVSPWVVVLLVILAGYVVFKVVFHFSTGGKP